MPIGPEYLRSRIGSLIAELRNVANHIEIRDRIYYEQIRGGYVNVVRGPGLVKAIFENLIELRDGIEVEIFELWFAQLLQRW